MTSKFSYLNTDLNQIFANNPSDFNYNKTVSFFTTNSIAKIYNGTNGSTTQQNNINYKYNNNTTNFSSGIQAFYIEYFADSSGTINYITIPNFCTKIRYYLVGGGGSGGAGGGDTTDRKGTDGAGGGGGGYAYGEVSVTAGSSISLRIGRGGASVSGGIPNSNNGNVGLNGENTVLTTSTTNYFGPLGTGGDGGHPTSSASPGVGGVVSGNIMSGSNSSGKTGGLSGYSSFNNANNFLTYFKPYSTASYGNGGNGTDGGHDPNNNPTGAGENGYARIYFMA